MWVSRATRRFDMVRPAVFPGGRIAFAIGDVHGRADLLERMLAALELKAARLPEPPIVIFIGDYIDRGPDSRRVLDLLVSGRPHGCERYFLMGNHERMMLDFLENPLNARMWLGTGGLSTLISYGVPAPPFGDEGAVLEAHRNLQQRLPADHLAFLERLQRYIAFGDFVFVHAGLDPQKKLTEQTDRDLYWIRGRFLSHRASLPHIVVHGHTPVETPHFAHSRIAIDTGAYATGTLTAVRLQRDSASFVSVTTTDLKESDPCVLSCSVSRPAWLRPGLLQLAPRVALLSPR